VPSALGAALTALEFSCGLLINRALGGRLGILRLPGNLSADLPGSTR
jgi:hypothetical protein